MRVVCCGCGIHLRDVPSEQFSDAVISHGICEKCAYHFMAQVGMPLPDYIEGISAPVVIVADDARIGAANKDALALLGKAPEDIQGHYFGDVFECRHAQLPGGCGKTANCSGCTIRNVAMHTFRTGVSHQGIYASLTQTRNGEAKCVDFRMAAEKKGGIVFVTVEVVELAAV